MSVTLPLVDMTGKVSGNSGQILLKTDATRWDIAGHAGEPATIRILNENGCGLKVWTDTNQINEYLGAGAWIDFQLEQGTLYLNWLVQYTIPNPPANVLMVTFYSPGEKVPPMATLGNSPIGGGTTTSLTGSTLSNEGNSTPALIIDIGQVANTNLINIFSDGSFTWNIVVSGVVHTLMKGQTATNFLKLGQSGDTLEALGNLLVDGTSHIVSNEQVDGTSTVNGAMTVGGGFTLSGGDVNLGAHNILTGNNITVSGNVGSATMSTTGLGNFNTLQSGGYLQNAGDADINGHKVLNVLQLKFNNGNLIAGINCGTFVAGALTGTQNHGLVGTPSVVMIGGADTTGTTTSSAFSYTSTQFSWRVNNSGQTMAWLAMKFS